MTDHTKKAQEQLNAFLDRLTSNEVAAFHISYVGHDENQEVSFTGGFSYEKLPQLLELMETAVKESKTNLRRHQQ